MLGYNGPSWIVHAARSTKDGDAKALMRLMSPQGRLFSAIYNADSDGTIKFHFPRQRLPAYTQMLLENVQGKRVVMTWPQYEGIVQSAENDDYSSGQYGPIGHLHVSVFQYFFYWFAFFAIRGSSGGGMDMVYGMNGGRQSHGSFVGSSMKRAVDALHFASSSRPASGIQRNLYVEMLKEFLFEFLPRPIETRPEGVRRMKGSGASFQVKSSTGQLMYSIFLEFWLKDSDEKIPGTAGDLHGGDDRKASRWLSSYEPPGDELFEVLEVLTSYIFLYDTSDGRRPAQGAQAWLPMSPVLYGHVDAQSGHSKILQGPRNLGLAASVSPQAYARQLYRLLFRAFTCWPDQRSIKPLLKVFLCMIAPWQYPSSTNLSQGKRYRGLENHKARVKTHMSDFVHLVGLDIQKDSSAKIGKYSTAEWENHVLANLPFYLDLIPLFLELSVSRVGARGEPSVSDVMKVIQVLDQAPALLELLQSIELHVNKCITSNPKRAEGPHAEIVPWIIDQTINWRAFASSGSMQSQVKNSRMFSLFSVQTPCAALYANDIMTLASGILKRETQKSLEKCMNAVLPLDSVLPGGHPVMPRVLHQEIDGTARIPKKSWEDVRIAGDKLCLPRTSYEMKYLVDIMILLSKQLNTLIGLDRPYDDKETAENIIDVVLLHLRKNRWIINLRPLADIRNLFWGPLLLWACITLVRLFYWTILVVVSQDAKLPS